MAGPPPQPNFLVTNGFLRGAAAGFSGNFVRKEGLATEDCTAQNPRSVIAEKEIQRSSVVERSAVNRLVVGSNPTAGANFLSRLR
jgi:hypothetical protein